MINEMNTESILEEVLGHENINAAYLAVKANNGAAGVDKMNIERTREHLLQHWETIESKLWEGRYKPAAVRAVEIPKPNGGIRTLGIPTVTDRIIQQAILQVLTPVFDPGFSECSYGFRPKRSAGGAGIRERRKTLGGGHRPEKFL